MSLNKEVVSYLQSLHKQADNDYNFPLYIQRYMAISQQQGKWLHSIVIEHKAKNIVEFGASFGISTIYLAAAAKQVGGQVITSEIEPSKISSLRKNLKNTNLTELVDVRVGNALETLSSNIPKVDLLFMDGYKTMYPELFTLLEPLFHSNTIIIADNTDMKHASLFKDFITKKTNYSLKLKQFKRSEVSIVSLV